MAVHTPLSPPAGAQAAGPAPQSHRRGWPGAPELAAVLVWAVGSAAVFGVLRGVHFDPWTNRGAAFPLGVGVLIGAAALVLCLRRRAEWVSGAVAGAFATFVTLVVRSSVHGTPIPYGGVLGDSGRLTAMATHYSQTIVSSDAWIPGLPAEYPPLFPWLIGRLSALTGVAAWRLLSPAEAVTISAALVAGYVMWRRLVPGWLAVLVPLLGFVTNANPNKAYETLTLAVFVPWALATAGRPPRGRLHWLTAGIILGLLVQVYYGWLIFGFFGLLAIVVQTWRSEPNRWAYVRYLVKVLVVGLVLASWYLLPYAYAVLTKGSNNFSDLYGTAGMNNDVFGFLNTTPLALLQIIGAVGMFWLWRNAWWASGMLWLAVGAFVYRGLWLVGFVLTPHTGLGQYAGRLYAGVLAMAGVLTLAEVLPRLLGRLSLPAPRQVRVLAMTLILCWAGFGYWQTIMPAFSARTAATFAEPLPDGTYVAAAANVKPLTPWFPVTVIESDVQSVRGPQARPVTLSVDERLFAYLGWPGYVGTDRNAEGGLSLWDQRYAQITKLVAINDPAQFDQASAHTPFGPIDAFVLQDKGDYWQWHGHFGYGAGERYPQFSPGQFSPVTWAVFYLPDGYVLAVRR